MYMYNLLENLVAKYGPLKVQEELTDIYYKMLNKVEPDYVYIPKDKRKKGEEFVEPETPDGRFWLKIYLASRNLTRGIEKWFDDYADEIEEENE